MHATQVDVETCGAVAAAVVLQRLGLLPSYCRINFSPQRTRRAAEVLVLFCLGDL